MLNKAQNFEYAIHNMYTFHCARGPLHCDKCLKERHAGKRFCLLKLYLDKGIESRPVIEFEHKYYEFEIVKIFEDSKKAISYAEENEISLYIQS
ncbi:MAG: hypothetical protein ACXAB7_04405 [Candidatus Kariarchaeaceae archaeon]|jgi:hypothetical protein